MRKPSHQAAFFRLLAHVLCYSVSGNNDVGYLSKDEWNPYWRAKTGLEVSLPLVSLVSCPLLHMIYRPGFLANRQKRPVYECIQVNSYHELDSVLNEEGDLDNESDDSDYEMEMMRKSRHRESGGSEISITARYGSPMSVE